MKSIRERCDQCGHLLKPQQNLPKAVRLYVEFSGRMLYSIEGQPGLFQVRTINESTDNTIEAITDYSFHAHFGRCHEAEERLQKALEDRRQEALKEPSTDPV